MNFLEYMLNELYNIEVMSYIHDMKTFWNNSQGLKPSIEVVRVRWCGSLELLEGEGVNSEPAI